MTSQFEGKVALVTGAGSGLGEAIAMKLAHEGATVIVADVSGKQDAVAAALGSPAVARTLDVSSQQSVLELETWITETYGGLDVLANNAGIGGPQALTHEYPIEAFDAVMAVNVRGAYMVLQAGLRLMLASGGGAVVNTASIGGFRATPYSSGYITSKGASVMMTRTAALEYAQQGIRVNAVAPGVTRTPILDGSDPDVLHMLESQVPQGRLGEPSDVANVVAFLADDALAPHITGQIWAIDGGRSAG
ncbi:SDR family NAD(P)-dependent oxidoreductase [Agreia sp. VKM Ac-1783]|uniref:SDR family NAD(P)-dependent oxidoreductase n=1 Tax=Agreia sp. VKM Ac-1783 TaxID=1938889 RepID=UPI000A2AB490|nr:SDR family NAD(P)-dependent oxidoreductase [Agreia sp. VKM Ac-1783]SMQ73669.1 NAD(P)-dependent dehydrogenase, short-chain alcohol dehydrogenase family [Agreia sp. VKM Ac-1783]